uniref:Uncharacterized protein n=1 Tax=Heterorhabditis bacteriophora TaxID=37862 RepID=A0A1I7XC57_HETBA
MVKVSYSDYSSEDEENDAFWQTLRDGHYSDNDSPLHKYGTTRIRKIDSENSEEERELRREKRKLRKDARRLAQRERELRERERRLMESIAKKRKSKQKFAKNKTQEVYQWSDNCNDENEVADSTDTEVESDGRNWNAEKSQ